MHTTFCFSVHSHPTPSSLPRVLDVFAAHGLVPRQCYSQLTRDSEQTLVIDLQLDGVNATEAARLARRIERVHTVDHVLVSTKRLHVSEAA